MLPTPSSLVPLPSPNLTATLLTAQSRGLFPHISDHSADTTQARPASSTRLLSVAETRPTNIDRSRCQQRQTAVPPRLHHFTMSNTSLKHAYRDMSRPSAICYAIPPGTCPRTDRASISGLKDSPSAKAAMTLSRWPTRIATV
jgi:hypothetical protein